MRLLPCFIAAALVSLCTSCGDDSNPPAAEDETGTASAPIECGNGLREPGEVCEGTPLPEGCNPADCTVLPDWTCLPVIPDPGDPNDPDPPPPQPLMSMCTPVAVCGDGVVETQGGETCDDGNDVLSDGCSNCVIDPLWECMGEPSDCFKCGDGFLDMDEQCDDGEDLGVDSPGCVECMIVPGWDCFENPPPSLCGPVCGDGMWFDTSIPGVTIGFAEQCDDGNLVGGDGCDPQCNVEDDCECDGNPPGISTCVCGLVGTSSGTDSSGSGSSSGSDTGGTSSGTGTTTDGGANTTGN
ncbi:MAG: DUF4215 domain-containing protein [Deltaproteobacteria bacterium]|nr:DUF4215 domain-containing protein [Deltaproteobacteria bacterium]